MNRVPVSLHLISAVSATAADIEGGSCASHNAYGVTSCCARLLSRYFDRRLNLFTIWSWKIEGPHIESERDDHDDHDRCQTPGLRLVGQVVFLSSTIVS